MNAATETYINRDIYQLQQDAVHGVVAVSTLLRRALLWARAKGDTEFVDWIRKELDGYPGTADEIPQYRVVPCELWCWNRYHGWLPVQFVRPSDAESWSKRPNNQGVPVLESLLGDPRHGSTQLQMTLRPEAQEVLARTSNYSNPRHTQFVSSTTIETILAAVRNRILDWTMQFDLEGYSPGAPSGSTHMDIQAKRFQFLAALHDAVEGDRHRIVNMFKIGESLGFDRKTTDLVVQFLTGESLVKFQGLGGLIGITHHGVREVEDARSEPSTPTEYFPPSGSVPPPPSSVTNIVNNYGNMGSVQQAGSDSTQEITHDERRKITHVLEQVKGAVTTAKLDPTVKGDLEAQVGTVEAQLRASKPKMNIVRGCLQSLREILESAAGQALGAALPGILKGLGGILGG